jgi:hypothetical protein
MQGDPTLCDSPSHLSPRHYVELLAIAPDLGWTLWTMIWQTETTVPQRHTNAENCVTTAIQTPNTNLKCSNIPTYHLELRVEHQLQIIHFSNWTVPCQ